MTDTAHPVVSARIREFLSTGRRHAAVSSINPDGSPHQAVIWYAFDDDVVVINSLVGRRWPSNLLRDPRVSLAVFDGVGGTGGTGWVGLTGTAKPVYDQATTQADIAAMARRYHADDLAEAEELITSRFEQQERISFRVRIHSAHDHLDD